ncbi:MAG: hypothetical protein CMM46_17365 [Rhodospirillaceae bacterium]|nr:hypothetical protein [Rhodospirillaceae bacterium]|tara:strand:+ start:40179 stop:40568 length:390 start_codon:yes stop_codon:yes gene_type:complete
MTDRRKELEELTHQFVDCFNRQDIDGIAAFFAEDGVYEDSNGGSHTGPAAIKEAFVPLVCGSRGKISFDDEDFFAEPESDKVMASWTLNMEIEGKPMRLRGLDLLHFRGDKLVRKMAYCKAAAPQLTEG